MTKKKVIHKKIKASNRHWKNYVDKDYLGSHNLEEGEELELTVAKFEGEEEVLTPDGKGMTKQICRVLYFKEEVPKMILNMTNATTLASLYGSHPDQWTDKKLRLYAAKIKAFGKTQDALRIRDFIPQIEVDVVGVAADLSKAKNMNGLKRIWAGLPISARENEQLIKHKDKLKVELV